MANLVLHLKRKWWQQIADGEKQWELRRQTPYWEKRLVDRVYDEIHLYCGYPSKGDTSKVLRFKWCGGNSGTVIHEEFGSDPVKVFSIDLSQRVTR